MEITKELIATIFDRANQYAIAEYGEEPSEISIEEDGTLGATYIDYHCGEREETYRAIEAECLTKDLDEVVAERKRKEEAERQKRKEEAEKKRIAREKREKEARHRQYLALKKEFEND